MKLDTTELVMEIEDVFSITIPDEEACRLATVGDVFHYIFTITSVPKNLSVCLSAITFFSLRGAATALGAKNHLRPSDPTSAILPDSNRHQYWSELQSRSMLMLPPLRRPGWLVTICTVVVIACSVVFGILVSQSTNSQLNGLVAAIAIGLELGLIAGLLTRPFTVFPDSNCATLRGLAESSLAMNLKTLSDRYNVANKDDLWIALCSIIAEQHGISPEEVDPTGDLVNNLGCD